MKVHVYVIVFLLIVLVGAMLFIRGGRFDLPQGEAIPVVSDENTIADTHKENTMPPPIDLQNNETIEKTSIVVSTKSSRQIFETDGVKHSIPIDEIRQGCFGRDCIPSVEDPTFMSREQADGALPSDTVGIGLTFQGEQRFYPFNMLVTREIVNDEIGGVPLAVTYCPLCGTGIVFERTVNGRVFEFGVSGMLWQSNLLMYNRSEDENDISLWSQVLGEAVLGVHTGTKLPIVQSDIVRYTDWAVAHPDTLVIDTGRIGDPYGGEYYRVASSFRPNFDESKSPLPPTEYVFGVEINGEFKAYPEGALSVGTVNDTFAGVELEISKSAEGIVRITPKGGESLPIVTGFWFSWVAAHPETELFK